VLYKEHKKAIAVIIQIPRILTLFCKLQNSSFFKNNFNTQKKVVKLKEIKARDRIELEKNHLPV